MRVTTKMMNSNLMGNINTNKNSVYDAQEQYSTGKVIQRPSDDPVVAIRSMKLRTNISEMEQYLNKNIPDAMSWMDITESAMKSMNNILEYIYKDVTKGANDTLTTSDRSMITESLTQLKTQIYQEGNANYAGRYVFTGYRTDSSLTFQKAQSNETYEITQTFSPQDITKFEGVNNTYNIQDYKDGNITKDGVVDGTQTKEVEELYRIRLGYDNLKNDKLELTVNKNVKKSDVTEVENSVDFDIATVDQTKTYYLKDTKELVIDGQRYNIVEQSDTSKYVYKEKMPDDKILIKNSYDKDAYVIEPDEVAYFADTGEIVMGKDKYDEFSELGDNAISVTYIKNEFKAGDVKPEHYFDCKVTNEKNETKEYKISDQEIGYEVNFSQNMVVNSQITNVLSIDFGRAIDDMVNALSDVDAVENKISEIDKLLDNENLSDDERKSLQNLKEQSEIELSIKNKQLTNSFEKGLDEIKGFQEDITISLADLGSKYSRLELIQSRLDSQLTDYTELLSTNEDVDMVDAYIKYSSMEAIYNASLSVASKVSKNSLLDFI